MEDESLLRKDSLGFDLGDLVREVAHLLTLARDKDWDDDIDEIRIWDIEFITSLLHHEDPPHCVVILTMQPDLCPLIMWLNEELCETRFPNTRIEGF